MPATSLPTNTAPDTRAGVTPAEAIAEAITAVAADTTKHQIPSQRIGPHLHHGPIYVVAFNSVCHLVKKLTSWI
jgi:hypothetical protein